MLALPAEYATWAARAHLAVAPTATSPLCPASPGAERPSVAIAEPRGSARYLFDPDTPRELSTVHLRATATPASEEVVWLVDGTPVGQVAWPHELRWPMTKGTHLIRARLAHSAVVSPAVTIVVDD
jgi:membrane carboxypeptidase/penicillin-binding protein PbpC